MPDAKRPLLSALLCVALLAPWLSQAQTAARQSGTASAHEQQLQAIRQALIDATLETPTQVISTSWIDNMGALRESHQFNSKAEFRGARLLSLGKDDEETGTARASAEVLPWGWRLDKHNAAGCGPAPRSWRVPLAILPQMDPGFPGPQQAAARGLLQAITRNTFATVQQSERWTATEPLPQIPNTYYRNLVAPPRDEGRSWQMSLSLHPVESTTRSAPTGVGDTTAVNTLLGPAPWIWNLRIVVQPAQSTTSAALTRWQQDVQLSVDVEKLANHPTQWRAPVEAELNTRMGAWLASIEQIMRCEPAQFSVRKQPDGSLHLLAGQGSGLRNGDRVLIMQPGWVPSRMLEPQAADHLALAEVVRTGPRHTEIRQLAGPPLAPGGDWVALPL